MYALRLCSIKMSRFGKGCRCVAHVPQVDIPHTLDLHNLICAHSRTNLYDIIYRSLLVRMSPPASGLVHVNLT